MCSPQATRRSRSCARTASSAAIGAGMNQSAMLADLVRETDLDVVMLAGRYTLLEQDALDDLLPLCCERRVAVVAAGVFNSGLLARECPPDDAKYDYGEAPRRLVERAQAIARICGQHGTTLPAAALAFPLGHPAVASVCVGARSAAQMAQKRGTLLASRSLPTCGASSRRRASSQRRTCSRLKRPGLPSNGEGSRSAQSMSERCGSPVGITGLNLAADSGHSSTSRHEGEPILFASRLVERLSGFATAQGRQGSNLRPSVLETSAALRSGSGIASSSRSRSLSGGTRHTRPWCGGLPKPV